MFNKTLLTCCILAGASAQAFNLGEHTVTDQSIAIAKTAQQVLITGVASLNDAEPGNVLVSDNGDGSVSVRFAEWDYQDGNHQGETVSTLTLEKGRHEMADGSVWEVGSIVLDTADKEFRFLQQMPQMPYLFLSGQSDTNQSSYVTRASNVNQLGFSAYVQYQELPVSGRVTTQQTVAYLAIYAPNKEGRLDSGEEYSVDQVVVDHTGTVFKQHELTLLEEQSKDTELTHIEEIANVLTIDGHLFAQDITSHGSDTVSIRANKDAVVLPSPYYTSCNELLQNEPQTPTGFYVLDQDGNGAMPEFTTYCNMDEHGGGWTLVGLRRVVGYDYANSNTMLDGWFEETQNITSFDANYHLTDAQWVNYKNSMQEMYMVMPAINNYAIADISVLNTANCIPLQDTLGQNTDRTGEARFRLFWHESSGCSGGGQDYTMLNYANIYNFNSAMYKQTNVNGYAHSQVTYIYVR
ncbi:hypothetical protein CWB99_03170 [Pseudoalteromonas rubra]|uniref:Fibrinogen C-terminal domain-containing protein n=1 Tax=Pseudoalteromonas rubra TaxID=43658 RepID=A0A5S3WSF3_9GAMM|nr:fibrinogen-like YCDxxxxGGGW domain-containing protein [Pseudoalteromonas rubra]TMP30156.1 hypothetical protein CWC00_17315 [Pseudoalteromonas rubra]TMP31976.1 hypothetical protein CWB99_03170 [Pseudoalteromonas rubra]